MLAASVTEREVGGLTDLPEVAAVSARKKPAGLLRSCKDVHERNMQYQQATILILAYPTLRSKMWTYTFT
jgi:hypothetical protein